MRTSVPLTCLGIRRSSCRWARDHRWFDGQLIRVEVDPGGGEGWLPCITGVIDGGVGLAARGNMQFGIEPCNCRPVGAGLYSCCDGVQGVVCNDLSSVESRDCRCAQRDTSKHPRRPATCQKHDGGDVEV